MYRRPEVRKNRTLRLLDREWQAILDCADVLRGRDGSRTPHGELVGQAMYGYLCRLRHHYGRKRVSEWGQRGFAARFGEGAAAERFDPAILDGPGEPRSDV